MFSPNIRDVTPLLIPHLITENVTKRPRTITDLCKETGLAEAVVRGCLRVLAMPERSIVRPLDANEETWEISHDFLVPLLESLLARWTFSVGHRVRPWIPWIVAASMAGVAISASIVPPPTHPQMSGVRSGHGIFSVSETVGMADDTEYKLAEVHPGYVILARGTEQFKLKLGVTLTPPGSSCSIILMGYNMAPVYNDKPQPPEATIGDICDK